MVKYWTIHPAGVSSGRGPQSQLISCKIAELSDEHGKHYAFFGPNGTWKALQDGDVSVHPVQFPEFKAELNGGSPLDWFIEISSIDVPAGKLSGTWGNKGYRKPQPDHEVNPGDTDTWTAQASSGGTGQEETVAFAASARQ